ncbi:MAG: PSD1 and planctomycete cytochrome C domain-containing protein [Pirellulaceae bacterium]|nr:PSD1 and planctomycete cytochrome C domain-containing protein [Pirellulaceae bacterium]
MSRVVHLWLTLSIAFCVVSCADADEKVVDYVRDIKPILKTRCYACHGALKQESELRLDSGALLRKGGVSGPLVGEAKAEINLLLERVSTSDPSERMPPEGERLSTSQVELLRKWIEQGALSPEDEQPEEDIRKHWAFQVLVRPKIPSNREKSIDRDNLTEGANKNPIDCFLSEKWQKAGVQPLPTADRATLLRRLYIDLIGLPPTSEALEKFVTDESPGAYEAVVSELLESPQHGERWARHWMDVWRYSDWYGRRSVPDVMNSYPMIWRWRDWIVQSINQDKPYDKMIVEMLAADELFPDDERSLVATGYLVRSWFKWNYETWKKDLVEHTGKAFLGLTLNCAQCHDHKYDPLTQEEYFRFRAFFEPLELRHDRLPGEPDPGPFVKYVYALSYGPIKSGMVRVFDEYLNAETFMFSNGDSRLRMEGKPPVSPSAPSVLGGDRLQHTAIELPITAAYPGMKEVLRDEERAKRNFEVATATKQLAEAKAKWELEPADLREELAKAERLYNEARTKAQAEAIRLSAISTQNNAVRSRVLAGSQSLMLDAKAGRRALSHALPGLDSLSDNGKVTYLIRIAQDGITNLQLGLDIDQGATGGYVAFEKGTIKTYAPGGFTEMGVGSYDVSKGQDTFRVEMQLDVANNQFLLSVTSLGDNQVVVNGVPAALNGWKPQANGKRGLFIDCREGTAAIYDDLRFTQSDGSVVLQFDFEPPDCIEGSDITEQNEKSNVASWRTTGFCVAPATSLVISTLSENPDVQAALVRLNMAELALKIPLLSLAAAEANLESAKLEQASLESRMTADSVRYSTGKLAEDRSAEPSVKALIQAACQAERVAGIATAKANLAVAEAAMATAEASLAAAKEKQDQTALAQATKDLQLAQKQRVTASEGLSTAQAAASKERVEYTALSPKYPQVTTGRRAALARWIANKENPLTARVAVNHVWLRHFGQALVDTPHDFGRNGSRPTHPELLDWLACELMDSGWSLKHLHRLIVTSQAYKMASITPHSSQLNEHESAAASVDPDNRTYWRFPSSRMQAEVVRDSLLALSGELDQTMGGHEIDHQQGMTSRRRSLYFAHHGEEKMEFLELFDAANACDCYRRSSSVQPQQALALINSDLTKSLSRQLQTRLWVSANANSLQTGESEAVSRFVRIAFLQVLNREPRGQEIEVSLKFLQEQADRLTAVQANSPDLQPSELRPAERARANFIHALMNHNDFVTLR